jgi:hypothetical protein
LSALEMNPKKRFGRSQRRAKRATAIHA